MTDTTYVQQFCKTISGEFYGGSVPALRNAMRPRVRGDPRPMRPTPSTRHGPATCRPCRIAMRHDQLPPRPARRESRDRGECHQVTGGVIAHWPC